MLSVDGKNSRGYLLWSARTHPMFLAKLRGVVMFSEICGVFVNDVTKCVCVFMIDVCIKFSEIHMARFQGGLLCTILYGCIFYV